MHGNENTAFYTNQDAPVDQSGDMMQQPVMSDAGHPPESKDAGSEWVESPAGKNKRATRRSRRTPAVVTPLIAEKVGKRMMELPQKMGGAFRKKQTAGDIIEMLIEPIKVMHERGYNAADIKRFLEQNGIHVSSAAVRAGMIKFGVLAPRKRATDDNKGGVE